MTTTITGIDCEVYLDGERFYDGTPGEDELHPVALSPLRVVWGRDTTLDQPEASTCEFDVMDLPGGESYLTRLRTGRRLDVLAVGMLYSDPYDPTLPDPDFTETPQESMPPSIVENGHAEVVGPPPRNSWRGTPSGVTWENVQGTWETFENPEPEDGA